MPSGDDSWMATGVSLAETTGYEWAAVVNYLGHDLENGVASVRRELEGGVEELLNVDLPAVLTIQTGINGPRYASMRGNRQAQRKYLNDLGIDEDAVDSALTFSTCMNRRVKAT